MIEKDNYFQWYQKGYQEHDCRAWKEDKVMETLTTRGGSKIMKNNLRIRKLTPRECGRLMGVKDEDITKILKHQSNASAYHLFGDSIVCDVLVYVFKNMMEDTK